jgi:Flp pilus assembly protein TadD/predicted aspartyl protease
VPNISGAAGIGKSGTSGELSHHRAPVEASMRTSYARSFVLSCAVFLAGAGAALLAFGDEPTPSAILQLADQAFQETRYRDAADAYRRARDHRDAPADTGITHRAFVGLIRSLLRVTRFTDARDEANRFTVDRTTDADAVTLDGETLWGLGLFAEAEQRFSHALTLNPNDPYANHGLARVLAAERKLEPALAHIDEAISLAPREIEPRYTRAFILERMNRYDEAAATLREAMTLFLPEEKSDRALFTRSQIRFLESFHGRTPLQPDPKSVADVHTVPFRLDRDKVIVKGMINGSQPMDLVLDTGAEMTVVGRRTAERLGVVPVGFTVSAGVGERGVRGLQVGRIDTLQVGSYKVKNVPTLIKSPSLVGIPRREADSFSPVSLGLSMTVDYGKRLLTFGRHLSPRGEIELPLYSYRLAVVRGTINGRTPASFVVDTGGEVISISTSMAAMLDPPRARRIPLKVYGSSGWDREAFLFPGLDLAFDRIRFENFSTVVLNLRAPSALLGFELGGIVGHRFLSKYQVGLDLDRNRLTLTPLADVRR